jgi:protein phosphatase
VPTPPDLAAAHPICLRAGAATSAGNRRRLNEDAHAIGTDCCVVADGIGGHAAGEVASAVAVAAILDALEGNDRAAHPDDVLAAIAAANLAVRERAVIDATPGMGTTVVIAAIVPDGVAVAHVGDSRCYLLRAGELSLVTSDHSLVQELVDAGRLASTDAGRHPMANVVTRALGTDPRVEPALIVLPPAPCRLLLCSDGLSDELPTRTLGRVLAGVDDPQQAAERLIAIALAGPARDNVTALVADVHITTPDRADHRNQHVS